jgi:hypothetical protein
MLCCLSCYECLIHQICLASDIVLDFDMAVDVCCGCAMLVVCSGLLRSLHQQQQRQQQQLRLPLAMALAA